MTPPGLKRSHLWIPASFAFVAAMLADYALEGRGFWLALLWPAGNCAAVAGAYFGLGAGVFGKRPDGSRSPAAVAWMLPFLAVQYLTWRLQVAATGEDAVNEAAPGLFVGRRPLPGEHPAEVDLVVDLTAEFPKPAYHPAGADYLCLPTVDGFVPEPDAYREAVSRAARARSVLAHCANGHGRAAAFMAALLVKKGLAKDVDEGLALVRKARPACRLNPVQREAAAAATS